LLDVEVQARARPVVLTVTQAVVPEVEPER
jgi:hypothetical protein